MAANTLFSLGEIYPSDFLKPDEQPRCEPIELKLVMEDNGLVHLEKTAPKEAMWGDRYWYSSSTNPSMIRALKDVVDSVLPHTKHSRFLDIACNDGTLLSYVPNSFYRVGVDPAGGEIYDAAKQHGKIYKEYFGETKFESGYFDAITCVSMFYDIKDTKTFCDELYRIMADDGILVLQMSYTPLMIRQLAFDNLCHEHYSYLDLRIMKKILSESGLYIVDCVLNDVNGGSFRLFVKKKPSTFSTQQYRDVCNLRVESLISLEENIKWDSFYSDICNLKERVVTFISKAKSDGKKIIGYGASTKGNTAIQFFGLNASMIDAIADKQPKKWGLRTVGTNIPIIDEESMRRINPEYLLLFPWHFVENFKQRESRFLLSGGKMIVTMPQFEIIGA